MFGVVGGVAGGILGALVGLSAGAVLRVAAAADAAETKIAKIENIVPSEQSDTGENAEHSDQEKK